MPTLTYDTNATNKLIAIYLTPDIEQQRNKIIKNIDFKSGQKVLDVGSGPGFLCDAMLELVGPKGYIVGIDISKPLLEYAINKFGNRIGLDFHEGSATELPFESNKFDVIISTQVLEYVDDIDKALKEFYRVLKPGGKVALLDTDWDSIVWYSNNYDRMGRVLKTWEKHASDPFLPRTLTNRLSKAGFEVKSQKIIPIFNTHFDPETYSNRLMDLIVQFIVKTGDICSKEAEAWANDLREYGKKGDYFFSLNRYFFLAIKL